MQADEDGVIRMVPQRRAHTLRVLLIDDHLMMSEALASRLARTPVVVTTEHSIGETHIEDGAGDKGTWLADKASF